MSTPEHTYDRQQTAIQLVREAYELFVHPESRLDVRDWLKVAKTVLEDQGRMITADEFEQWKREMAER
jgi:hypothetical protein